MLFAGVGVVVITATNQKNNNQNKETTGRVEADSSEEEDATTTDKAEDGHKELKGVSESSGSVYEQDDTVVVNPDTVDTAMGFATVTTTSVVVDLGSEQEESQVQSAKADDLELEQKASLVQLAKADNLGAKQGGSIVQSAKTENISEQMAVADKTKEDKNKDENKDENKRSFEGAVSVPDAQDVNEEEETKRIEKAKKAEEEAKKAEEEKQKAAELASTKVDAEEEARLKAEEAATKEREEKARIAAELENENKKKAEEAARKAEEERLKAEEEVRKAEEETRKAEEEARKAEEEARKKAEEEARALAEAEALVQMLHSEHYEGNVFNGANTYPWQTDCPDKQDYYVTYLNGLAVGGYVCECVSYAGWKAYETWNIPISWGNAYSWDDRARMDNRFYVDNTPATKTIGQMDNGPYGHVFWVESVNQDGSINVTEYNNAYATQLYSGVYRFGDFGARTISASEAGRYNYIHLK